MKFIPIKKSEYRNKEVLLLGCGNGKELQHIAKYGPKQIIAVDISDSIYYVREASDANKNVVVIRSNILDLPFTQNAFDIIVADRVFHHIKDWEGALRKIYPLLREGGVISFTVFSRENNGIMRFAVEPIKSIMHRLFNLKQMYFISFMIAIPLYLLIKFCARVEKIGVTMPLLETFLFWRGFGFSFLRIGVCFDLLSTPLAHYISKTELLKLSQELNVRDMSIKTETGTLWSIRSGSAGIS